MFNNICRALRSEYAVAFDSTVLKDMHRNILFNCGVIDSYLKKACKWFKF